MRILIINQPLGNRGDESAHKGLVRHLLKNFKDIHIDVLFCGEDQNRINEFVVSDQKVHYINQKRRKGFGRFAIKGLKKKTYWKWLFHPSILRMIFLYRKADLVLNAPGGICMGGFQFWDHLFYLMLAKKLKKPIVYYGRSFGPFPEKTEDNRLFKSISLELLNYFCFLSIRDKKTEDLAKKLNLSYESTIDSAFLDSPSVPLTKEIDKLLGNDDYMVFVPNSLIWHYAYKDLVKLDSIFDFYLKMISCIKKFNPGIKIVMLPQLYKCSDDDFSFFQDIKKKANDPSIIVLPDTCNSDIQQSIIKKAKFLVGARYHSVVFSINQATPFIALSYEHKIQGLLEKLNKQSCMIDISSIWQDKSAISNALNIFEQKLYQLNPDEQARLNAKNIAEQCFSKFVKITDKLS